MKKWLILFAVSLCIATAVSWLNVQVAVEKKIVYLHSGDAVIADQVNRSDLFVFYEADGKSGMFMNKDVASVGSIEVERTVPLMRLMDRVRDRTLERLGWSDVDRWLLDSRMAVFVSVLTATVVFWKLFQGLRQRVGAGGRNDHDQATLSVLDAEATVRPGDAAIDSDLRDIAQFFLMLFKVQNGLRADAKAHWRLADPAASRSMTIFELSARAERDWLTRRMSVGPLGEETGSKSKCYYVIYDTHMVLKLPPTPVTDMKTYLNTIRKEADIAARLSPVACIVPTLCVVLNKAAPPPRRALFGHAQLERHYIRLVEEKPEYEAYLKVGGRFAFFMELTNNIFLGRVIDELHAVKDRIGEEIREVPEVAWNQEAFTRRYGLGTLSVFNDLQALYRQCEAEVQRIVRAQAKTRALHTFEIKSWFLSKLAGEALDWVDKAGDKALLGQIEEGFSRVFESNRATVGPLLHLLRSQLTSKTFVKNRQQMENIASNTLVLLCRLKEKQIALRDLKPDNLFLDANPDDYPDFLHTPDAFAIGVIDVETAVALSPGRDGRLEQPQLGGTPLYATPLHLLSNESLCAMFRSLPDTLHYQDWYAVIAICFRTLTGKNLFVRAAKSFPLLVKRLKQGRIQSEPDEETGKAVSEKFWTAALADVKKGLTASSVGLRQLTLTVPEGMAAEITAELKREREYLQRAIVRHVALSPFLRSERDRQFLVEASIDTLSQQIRRWERPEGFSERRRRVAPKMVLFLGNLIRLKEGEVEKAAAWSTLSEAGRRISAYSLLEAMFQIVYRNLHVRRWGSLVQPMARTDHEAAATQNGSLVTTTLSAP